METPSTSELLKVIANIKSGKIAPIYLISGDEIFLIKEATHKILEAILPGKEKDLNLEIFDGNKENWDEIISSLKTFGWFGKRRVICVNDTRIFLSKFSIGEVIERSKENLEKGNIEEAVRLYRIALGYEGFKTIMEIDDAQMDKLPGYSKTPKVEAWLGRILGECRSQNLDPLPFQDNSEKLVNALSANGELRNIPDNNTILLSTQYIDRRKRLYKLISEKGVIIDLSIQRARRSPAEIEQEERTVLFAQANEILLRSNKKISKDALNSLASKTGFNIGIFINELEKVINLVGGKEVIEAKDIEMIVGKTQDESIFSLQDAIGNRDFLKAISYLNELFEQGEYHLALLKGIVNEIKRLILAKEIIETRLNSIWEPKMNEGQFLKRIYFPVILKERKEKDNISKLRNDIYRMPATAILNLFKCSEKYRKDELLEAMKILGETDLKMKTLRISPKSLLEDAIIRICG